MALFLIDCTETYLFIDFVFPLYCDNLAAERDGQGVAVLAIGLRLIGNPLSAGAACAGSRLETAPSSARAASWRPPGPMGLAGASARPFAHPPGSL